MEIFRNYIKNEPKKPLTMEDSWSKICTRWAHSLELSPVKELISLTDGKFFAAFMSKYLPWKSSNNTVTETFRELEAGLRNEFPFGPVVRISDAKAGHEEELVKLVTLLMYLAVVKHHIPILADTLQDNKLFNKEVQLRFKCILQALMEQHSMLTPALLGEIIMSNVSETTGQLSAPVVRARLADRPATRVGKPSPGSPVIFSSSGSGSPLKDFLDSPQTRQLATYQRMLEERNAQTRILRTELETEKTERQFMGEEAARMKEQTKKVEVEIVSLRQELRDKAAMETPDSSMNEGEISQKYHLLITEQKEQGKYLAKVEQQLAEVEEDKSRLETRLQGVMDKLSTATDDKHRVEMTMDDMKLNLTETRSENSKLSENVEELQGQVEDLSQQLQFSFLSGGRKSMAPSMASFHFNPCDMTNVSLDADDSVGGVSNSFGENMGDVVGQQQEERIDTLVMEKGQLEGEIEIEREVRERTQVELQKEKGTRTELLTQIEEMEKVIILEKESKSEVEGALDNERVEKGVLVMEVNKLRAAMEALENKQFEDQKLSDNELAMVTEQFSEETRKCAAMKEEVTSAEQKIEQIELELAGLEEVRVEIVGELSVEKNKVEFYEKELSEEKSRVGVTNAELEASRENLSELNKQLEDQVTRFSELSNELQEEKERREVLRKEVEESRIFSEEINISQLAENKDLTDKMEMSLKEKANMALELIQIKDDLVKSEDATEKAKQIHEQALIQMATKKETIMKLEKCRVELEQRSENFVRDMASADERLESLQNEKFESLEKIDEIEAEKKSLSADNGLLEAKVSSYEEHIENLGAQIVEKEASIENLTNHMETQRNHHLNKDAELTSANDKITNLEKKLVSKTQEAVAAVHGEDSKSKEAAMMQASIEQKSQLLMELQAAFTQKCLEMQEKEQELETRIEQLGNAGDQMGRLNAELAEAKDDIENKELETGKLKIKLEDKQSELQEVVSKATELAVTIENLSDKIQHHERELTVNVSSSDLKKQESVCKIKELESKLAASEESNIELEEEMIRIKEEAEKYAAKQERERQDLDHNLTAYAEQLRDVKKQESNLQEEKIRLEADLGKIRLELNIKISGCEEHLQQIEELQGLLKNKVTENDQVFKFVEEKELLIKDLECKVKSLCVEKESKEAEAVSLKDNFEKEVVLKGLKEEELRKLKFLLEESTSKLSGDEEEIVHMKETKIQVEKEIQLLKVEKINLTKNVEMHLVTIGNLEADNDVLSTELGKVQEESKSMDQILEDIEQKRQELELEKQRLNETINEVGANCEKRGEEIKQHLSKIGDLERKLENHDELTHKLEFLQSQMEEMDGEKDRMKSEMDEVMKEKMILEKDHEAIQQSMSNVAESTMKELKDENVALKSKIDTCEKLHEESSVERLAMVEKIEKLQSTQEGLAVEKEDLRNLVGETLEEKNKLAEKSTDLDTKLQIQNDKLTKYEENVASLSSEMESLKADKSGLEEQMKEVAASRDKVESRSKKLEEELKITNASKDSLASSVSQLITDTNELKDKVEFKSMEHEKERLIFEREKQELKTAIEEKEQTLAELQKESQGKESVETELKVQVSKNEELQSCINNVQSEVDKLKHDLASAEIRYTDLEQATQENGVTEIKEALKAQKERYETNHKKIVDGQTEKYKSKLKEFAKITEEQIEKKTDEVKKIDDEKKNLSAKCESYKAKVTDMVGKMDENEKLNSEQVEVLHSKYSRSKEEIIKLQKKYEAAKSLIHKLSEEKQNLLGELDMKVREVRESDSEILKRELVQVRTENRTLTNQLSYADTKLREVSKIYEVRPNTRSRENSMSQNSERTSLDFRSRESISSIVRGSNMPRTSSRESLSRDPNQSRDGSVGGSLTSARSRPSVPGRADRQSRQSSSTLDDSVFKLPGPNTPGRAKQGRTVSDSRMAAIAASRYKPPTGSGSLFHCDEEAGEMFSSSYLTDLKEGLCDLTDNADSRMSELARRNTLCLPHLKSAYPVESQFCQDDDVTEEAIRHSRIGRPSDLTAPSPVTRLSQAASNLSLESPASSTRSKKSISQSSEQSAQNRVKFPPPTAFTIDPPKPGTAVRKSTGSRSTVKLGTARTISVSSMTSKTSTSSIGSLSRARPARPPRPVKQACSSEHGARKQHCEDPHGNIPFVDDLENLPVDDPVSRYLSEGDQSVSTPGRGRKRKSLGPSVQQQQPLEELDVSQDSFSSSFSRSSLRSSKRLKGGNISYTRPGPPTPGRNKSLGNLSLPRTNNTSVNSLETTTSYPGVSSNTPDMSRVSSRSAQSLKTPLLDTTNTPNKSRNQSKLSKMTPLGLRKVLGSAFRTGKKYKLMRKQDNTINRDQSVKTTPLKSKDRVVSSPRKKVK